VRSEASFTWHPLRHRFELFCHAEMRGFRFVAGQPLHAALVSVQANLFTNHIPNLVYSSLAALFSSASMKSWMSPSRTAWVLLVSCSVRRSFTI